MAKFALVSADGVEDSEFRVPYDRLRQDGHEVTIVGLERGKRIRGKSGKELGTVDVTPHDVRSTEFDAVVIPGGQAPDRLRMDPGIVDFVSDFGRDNKPIAAICHGPSLLIEADLVEGRRLTSWGSIRTDLINAGARWEDRDVVRDGNLITSRHPGDLEAFCRAILEVVEAPAPA